MIDSDRLDELECWRPDDDTPDDAKVRIDTRDLRDLVALIPVVRAAMAWSDDAHPVTVGELMEALDDLRVKGAG